MFEYQRLKRHGVRAQCAVPHHGFITICAIIFLSALSSTVQALDGLSIMQKQEAVNEGYQDETFKGTMTIVNSRGVKTVREFQSFALEKTAAQGGKALIKITSPADLFGVGLLSHKNKDRADDQWLYLPALKKTKRIAGDSRNGRFIGSDFTYEDLSPWEIEDYTYKFHKIEPCGGHSCQVVISTPLKTDSQYSKSVLWVRTDTDQTVRADLYNRKGALSKRALFEEWKKADGKFWKAHKITMKDLVKKRETVLEVRDVKTGTGLGDSDFVRGVLGR